MKISTIIAFAAAFLFITAPGAFAQGDVFMTEAVLHEDGNGFNSTITYGGVEIATVIANNISRKVEIRTNSAFPENESLTVFLKQNANKSATTPGNVTITLTRPNGTFSAIANGTGQIFIFTSTF